MPFQIHSEKFIIWGRSRQGVYQFKEGHSARLHIGKTADSEKENLSVGNNIKSPKYLPNGTGVSVPNSIPVKAEKVIIIEGTATFYGNIKDIFDVKLYIEVNDEIRRQRFLQRAETERNQDLENAKKHWNYLICAGEKYIMPTRKDADIIINGNADLNYLAQIIEYLHIITNSFETEKSDIS